ncbi:hypothetical protein MMPV_005620 [Pyropia vietnamensis]
MPPSLPPPGRDRPATVIAPSILAADFAALGEAAAAMTAAGADELHVDAMDGHFVDNLTLGPPVVAALAASTRLPLDVHMMLSDPGAWVERFAAAGAASMTFHIETCYADGGALYDAAVPTRAMTDDELANARRLCTKIRDLGCRVGVALRPATPADDAAALVASGHVDMVLVMSVEPGFGGQSFMAGVMPKVTALRSAAAGGAGLAIQVDGGVSPSTVGAVAAAGANCIVAGSAVFGAPDPPRVIAQLRTAVDEAAAATASAAMPTPPVPTAVA